MIQGCSMGFHSSNVPLCTALARLKDEHGPLVEKMAELQMLVKQMNAEKAGSNESALQELQRRTAAFVAELDPHSAREEGVLFPMMAKYIGREVGPIAVMEFEHDQAKSNLRRFREEGFTEYLVDAVDILLQHFAKEEQVLFPMAQQMLTEDEKQELLEKMEAIR